ncbi:MAG: hypothetical protein H7338_00330 [Candidatus Sericytochromatia bacterium]|nr:hypothetical protein [Candidatus Sericytochromatia bacterium]
MTIGNIGSTQTTAGTTQTSKKVSSDPSGFADALFEVTESAAPPELAALLTHARIGGSKSAKEEEDENDEFESTQSVAAAADESYGPPAGTRAATFI